jgi:large subunit ribosomal protein L15
MVVRRKKKVNKLRGHRTMGHGNTKNHRGSGSRGGVGRAGMHKHKFAKYSAELAKGHKRKLNPKQKSRVSTIAEIDAKLNEWQKKGLVQKQDAYLVVDGKKLGISKILGTGNTRQKLLVQNLSITEQAAKKIKAAGGKVSGKEGLEFDEDDEFEVDDSADSQEDEA